jgi:hypothetical protein
LNLTGSAPGVVKGSWTEYRIEVPQSGRYRIAFRVASLEGSKGLTMAVDRTLVITQAVPATGGFKNWQTVTASTAVQLEAGSHILRVHAIDEGWKLNWFSIELDK